MVFSDTVLARFVRDFGDVIVNGFMATLYQSPIFNLIIYIAAVLALIRLARHLSSGHVERATSFIGFCVAYCLILPVKIGDKTMPVAYHFINTASVAISDLLQQGAYKTLELGSDKPTMPPGFVMNALIRAGTAQISRPDIRSDVAFLLDNCVPDITKEDGKPFSAADLFGGKARTDANGVMVIEFPYGEILKKRAFNLPRGRSNCYELLLSTRRELRRYLGPDDILEMPEQLYVGPNSGEYESASDYVTTWNWRGNATAQIVGNMATNLAEASAVQRMVLDDYFNLPKTHSLAGTMAANSGAMSPMTELTAHALRSGDGGILDGSIMRITTEIANAPSSIARAIGLDGAIDSGFLLHEINERIKATPYYISILQVFLKFIAPLCFLFILFRLWTPLTIWAAAWFLTLASPAILMLTRAIMNSLAIHFGNFKDVVANNASDPAFLNTGVSFAAANALIQDTQFAISVMLQAEAWILSSMFVVVPVIGGFLAHKYGDRMMSSAMSSMGRSLAWRAGSSGSTAIGKAGSAIGKGIVMRAAPVVGGGMTIARNAFKRIRFAKGGK